MFSCPTICSSICIHIVQVLWDFAGLPAMVCACCVPTGLWWLLTTRHIPPSSSGKLLKTARRKQINCRHCLFLAIRPASPHPNTNKGEKPKTKEGRNGRTPRNRRILDTPHLQFLSACSVCLFSQFDQGATRNPGSWFNHGLCGHGGSPRSSSLPWVQEVEWERTWNDRGWRATIFCIFLIPQPPITEGW